MQTSLGVGRLRSAATSATARGDPPRSSTSTSAEPTMTPSTWPRSASTCSRVRMPKPAHTGTVAAARTRSR